MDNIKFTKLGKRNYCDCYEKRIDPRGKIYYWLAGEPVAEGESEDSDVMAIQNGYISITPIHFNMTDFDLLKTFQEKF